MSNGFATTSATPSSLGPADTNSLLPVTRTTGTPNRSVIERAQRRTASISGRITTSVTMTSRAGTKGMGSAWKPSQTP